VEEEKKKEKRMRYSCISSANLRVRRKGKKMRKGEKGEGKEKDHHHFLILGEEKMENEGKKEGKEKGGDSFYLFACGAKRRGTQEKPERRKKRGGGNRAVGHSRRPDGTREKERTRDKEKRGGKEKFFFSFRSKHKKGRPLSNGENGEVSFLAKRGNRFFFFSFLRERR